MTYRDNVKLLLETRKEYLKEVYGLNRPEEVDRLRTILIDTRDLLRELNDESAKIIESFNFES